MQWLPGLREGCRYIISYRFLQNPYQQMVYIIVRLNHLLKRRKKQGYGLNLQQSFYQEPVSRKVWREVPRPLRRAVALFVLYFQLNNQDINFLIGVPGITYLPGHKRKVKAKRSCS